MPEPADIFILARSGRALAQSARARGWRPWVIDGYGDMDTRACAAGVVKVGMTRDGLSEVDVADALEVLARKAALGRAGSRLSPGTRLKTFRAGLIYGSGIEAMPTLLESLASRFELIGNGGEVVRAVKDPRIFFATLTALDIAYPATRFSVLDIKRRDVARKLSPDADGTSAHEWLIKRAGGAGGEHVRRWCGGAIDHPQRYFQQFLPGPAMSVLFVADSRRARVIGYNTLWRARHAGSPFAYGGAINRAKLSPSQRELLEDHVRALTAAFGFRGLNSLDFLLHCGQPRVLEINPRPGATCELYEPKASTNMLALHAQACRGSLPDDSYLRELSQHSPRAQIFVYANKAYRVPQDMRWPKWCHDLPTPGAAIPAHAPVCTVLADGDDPEGDNPEGDNPKGDNPEQVSRLADARRETVLNLMAATPIAA